MEQRTDLGPVTRRLVAFDCDLHAGTAQSLPDDRLGNDPVSREVERSGEPRRHLVDRKTDIDQSTEQHVAARARERVDDRNAHARTFQLAATRG
ncbi:hypothetical protein HRbin27_00634 [bacterium HR27]|nr:hypothetical protein HRbin27_00634 [bacterium HR27]